MGYDDSYARAPGVFGADPDEVLVRFADQIDTALPVLDVGAGQGRHALYLARLGRTVHALEPSAVGARQLTDAAARAGGAVTVFPTGFDGFLAAPEAYGAVLVFGLVPDLTRDQLGELARRLERWTARGGLVFLTGFTTDDPAFPDWPPERTRTFLAPGEVLRLLRGFEAVHHWEGLGPVHRHGDGPPERHGRFEAVLRRPRT